MNADGACHASGVAMGGSVAIKSFAQIPTNDQKLLKVR